MTSEQETALALEAAEELINESQQSECTPEWTEFLKQRAVAIRALVAMPML